MRLAGSSSPWRTASNMTTASFPYPGVPVLPRGGATWKPFRVEWRRGVASRRGVAAWRPTRRRHDRDGGASRKVLIDRTVEIRVYGASLLVAVCPLREDPVNLL